MTARAPGKMLLSILTVESVKDLVKHRSFVALIFLLLAADRFLRSHFDASELRHALSFAAWQERIAAIVFVDLPAFVSHWIFRPATLWLLLGLFLFKQVISLWPSSSLRGWHRQSQQRGLLASLLVLEGRQFLWDMTALVLLCGITLGWGLLHFSWCRIWWQHTGGTAPAWCFLGVMGLVWPVIMAALSYSSKLAVLQQGSYREKFGLYLKLFTTPRIFWGSWLFYLGRILVEGLFVAIIPVGALLLLDNAVLRILLACASITPSYSYVKMASFKFFLFIYRPYPLIQAEFGDYLANMEATGHLRPAPAPVAT